MAYNIEKLAKLEALKALAERVKSDYATKESVEALTDRVGGLETAGGEPNVITAVKVNGTAQTITDKAVDIKVPVKVSELNNDSKFQSDTQVATAIAQAIAASGHASFEKVDAVPAADEAKENVLYLVMNSKTKHYDIYAKVGATVELLDDTTVDLSGYSTTEAINALLAEKVDKEEGNGLSSNDYTDAEKTKLAGLENYTHPAHTAKTSGLYKVTVDALGHVTAAAAVAKADITALGIPAQDTTYSPATASANGLMAAADKSKLDGLDVATTAEVTEMLNEVFTVGA